MGFETCWGRRRTGMIQYTSTSDISRSVTFLRCLLLCFSFFAACFTFHPREKKNKTHMTSHPSDPLRWTYCTCKAAVLSQQTSAQTSCVRDQTLSLYPINGSKFLHWAIYFQKQWQNWKDSPCFEDLHQLVCLLFDLYSENAEDNNRLFLFPFFLDLYQCNQSSSS